MRGGRHHRSVSILGLIPREVSGCIRKRGGDSLPPHRTLLGGIRGVLISGRGGSSGNISVLFRYGVWGVRSSLVLP